MKKQFTADQFTPTEWDSAEQKAKFGNQFVRLVERGFQQTDFPKWFYRRLSMTFGHIAHYNQAGFWETWFSDQGQQLAFLRYTETASTYGSPEHTYCDVEWAIQQWLKVRPEYVQRLENVLSTRHEQHERNEYERLKVKFG